MAKHWESRKAEAVTPGKTAGLGATACYACRHTSPETVPLEHTHAAGAGNCAHSLFLPSPIRSVSSESPAGVRNPHGRTASRPGRARHARVGIIGRKHRLPCGEPPVLAAGEVVRHPPNPAADDFRQVQDEEPTAAGRLVVRRCAAKPRGWPRTRAAGAAIAGRLARGPRGRRQRSGFRLHEPHQAVDVPPTSSTPGITPVSMTPTAAARSSWCGR